MAYSRLFQTFFHTFWTDDIPDSDRKNKQLQRLAIMFPFRWWDSKEYWEDHLYFTYNDLKTKPTECLNQCLRLIARATKKNLPHYFAVQLRLIFKCFILNMDEEFDGIDYGSDKRYKKFYELFNERVHNAEHPYSDKEMRNVYDIPIIIPESQNGKIVWNFNPILRYRPRKKHKP